LTDADRGTLYLVTKEKNELWSKIAMGSESKEIKLKMGEGIAGWVAEKGETLNIEDAQVDERFNVAFDISSGYKTKSILCFPIKNKNEEVVGVLQLLNSSNEVFRKEDENILNALSTHAALALQNADLVEQLLKSERISSLGKMANFLINDIKKPILVSKRYAEHLKNKELDEDVIKVIDMLLEQLNNIADLVQSTSSYSDSQTILRSSNIGINELLEDYVNRVDSYVRSMNCMIETDFDEDVNVKIDSKEFFQCFNHLIKNACDAMPEGGTININTKKAEDKILLTVKDYGLGISESLHDKIFEPFMSHGKREGTGLGLSVTKKIIEEHGGTISVKSELGEGATFSVTLPISLAV
ncbi:MAG: GAF domain-containing sensor histidine kinase, partial [Candidatus Pacebacteria bacterium]|nr:GAF domain-containing sensor histidine kinase [Candidatus Paceibacterota bacterium]